jgi:hypothetical protein
MHLVAKRLVSCDGGGGGGGGAGYLKQAVNPYLMTRMLPFDSPTDILSSHL